MSLKSTVLTLALGATAGAASTALALKDSEPQVRRVCVTHTPRQLADAGVEFEWKYAAEGFKKVGENRINLRAQDALPAAQQADAQKLFDFAKGELK